MIKIQDVLKQLNEDISERKEQGGVDLIGLPTGFSALDYSLGGLRNDALYIVGGQSGLGKSSLALSLALNNLEQGASVWYTTLEMSAEMLGFRLLSAFTGVPSMRLERGKITNSEFDLVREATEKLDKYKFMIDDRSTTSTEFKESVVQYKSDNGLDLAVVDYASLFHDASESLYSKETTVSLLMRDTARVCDIPVICLVQLNRNSVGRENSKPVLSDIKQTAAYAQDAQAVMFVHRPHLDKVYRNEAEPVSGNMPEDAQIILSKNRSGPPGELDVHFWPSLMLWKDKNTEITEPRNVNI